MPLPAPYSAQVARLLALGSPCDSDDERGVWRDVPLTDYAALGLSPADAPELIALLHDHAALNGSDPECYGPVHAVRALIFFRAESAIPAIINAVRVTCASNDDYWAEDLCGDHGLALMGSAALDPICKVARDQREDFGTRITLFEVLEKIAESSEQAQSARPRVIAFFRELLRLAKYNDPMLNGSIIGTLAEMRAIEALPEIHAAFETENRPGRTRGGVGGVDKFGCGDLETVEKRIRSTPAERLRDSIRLAEQFIAEIKESLADRSNRDSVLDEEDEDEETSIAGMFDERDIERQTVVLERLRAELVQLERSAESESV